MVGRDKKRMEYPERLSLSSMGTGATNHGGSSTYLQAREHDTRILQIFLRYGGCATCGRRWQREEKGKEATERMVEKAKLRRGRRCSSPKAAGVPIRSDSLFIIRRAHLRRALRLVFMGSLPPCRVTTSQNSRRPGVHGGTARYSLDTKVRFETAMHRYISATNAAAIF